MHREGCGRLIFFIHTRVKSRRQLTTLPYSTSYVPVESWFGDNHVVYWPRFHSLTRQICKLNNSRQQNSVVVCVCGVGGGSCPSVYIYLNIESIRPINCISTLTAVLGLCHFCSVSVQVWTGGTTCTFSSE